MKNRKPKLKLKNSKLLKKDDKKKLKPSGKIENDYSETF